MLEQSVAVERRRHLALRVVFPDACELLKPFFDPANHWGGIHHNHDHLALRAVREQFPQLSSEETFVLIATVKRLHAHDGAVHPSP